MFFASKNKNRRNKQQVRAPAVIRRYPDQLWQYRKGKRNFPAGNPADNQISPALTFLTISAASATFALISSNLPALIRSPLTIQEPPAQKM